MSLLLNHDFVGWPAVGDDRAAVGRSSDATGGRLDDRGEHDEKEPRGLRPATVMTAPQVVDDCPDADQDHNPARARTNTLQKTESSG